MTARKQSSPSASPGKLHHSTARTTVDSYEGHRTPRRCWRGWGRGALAGGGPQEPQVPTESDYRPAPGSVVKKRNSGPLPLPFKIQGETMDSVPTRCCLLGQQKESTRASAFEPQKRREIAPLQRPARKGRGTRLFNG